MRAVIWSVSAVAILCLGCTHDSRPAQAPVGITQTTSGHCLSSNPSYGTSDIDGWTAPSAIGSDGPASIPAGKERRGGDGC